ncbi:CpsD/CapB family tyrosine-protein kinase [Eubacteriaceae bacterium ES3]|nr:CpsD/CapB family tyrosine-protein kinase [Eubacteriaceae bacterium ES3]
MFGFKKKKSSSKRSERNKKSEQQKIGNSLNFQATEAYKRLRTNLEFSFANDKMCKVIGVTSAITGEGKSLTSINLAYSIAANNKKVLIIEADFRKPTVTSKLGKSYKIGLTDLLVGHDIPVRDILNSIDASEDVKLDLAPAGSIPPNPAELLDSKKMKEFLDACSMAYDYIIIDLPPVTVVADAVIASKFIDGMVVVVRQDRSDQKSLSETIRQLKFSNTKILGFIFNSYTQVRSGYYKKYSDNYSYSDYSNSKYAHTSSSLTNG